MELETVKFLATLGVGGVLAGLMFVFYRKDTLGHAEAWRGQSEALLEVVKENTIAVTALQQTTAALRQTIEALRVDIIRRDELDRLREDRR